MAKTYRNVLVNTNDPIAGRLAEPVPHCGEGANMKRLVVVLVAALALVSCGQSPNGPARTVTVTKAPHTLVGLLDDPYAKKILNRTYDNGWHDGVVATCKAVSRRLTRQEYRSCLRIVHEQWRTTLGG